MPWRVEFHSTVSREGIAGCVLRRCLIGISVCHDRCDADHAARAGRHHASARSRRFSLAFLVYNLKFLWAWVVDGVRIPLLGRLGQRVSWLLLAGAAGDRGRRQSCADRSDKRAFRRPCIAADAGRLRQARRSTSSSMPIASRTLKPISSASGRGMSQYGWRIGSAGAAAVALVVAAAVRMDRRPTSPARCSRCPR